MVKELSNTDITTWCNTHPGLKKWYRGCIFKNQLPRKRIEGFFIMLLADQDEYDGNNGHWVLVYTVGPTRYYCDSMGICPPTAVTDYMGGDFHYLEHELQSLDSITCGYFSCTMAQILLYAQGLIDLSPSILKLYQNIEDNVVKIYNESKTL